MQKTTLLPQLAHGTWEERIQADDELAGHGGDAVVMAPGKALKSRGYQGDEGES